MLATLVSLFALGIVHGLGPDHVMAVAALGGGRERPRVLRVALRFGVGHASLLAVAGLALRLTGWLASPALERAGELANGALLVFIGLALAFEKLGRALTFHSHLHQHDGTLHTHLHAHAREHEAPHAHRHAAWVVGAMFALSGVRATVLALPAAAQSSFTASALALVAFGAGVVASMLGYALALSGAGALLLRFGLTERRLRLSLGGLSAALGCYWLVTV